MRNLLIATLLLLFSATTASAYKTPGNGTTYTLQRLSEDGASGVAKQNAEGSETTFILTQNDTITAGDRFVMDDGVLVQFDDGVTLVVEGEADFRLTKGSTFDSAFDGTETDPLSGLPIEATPYGIVVSNEQSQTIFTQCTFRCVGLRCTSSKGMALDSCNFYLHNGALGQAALTLGPDGAPFTIKNCHFEDNAKAAIAGAANYRNPLLIEDCTFKNNSTLNRNVPQLNLTVADSVVIRRCDVIGNPELNMVGGIGISNFIGATDVYARVSQCNVSDNRYGIALMGPSDIRIENNRIVNNRYETNANNGGSGINLYDPYQKTTAVVAGNTIEGNLWGITIIGCHDVNLGQPTATGIQSPGGNVFKDNGNGGMLYDVYNNSALTVYAQNNTWGVSQQTQEQIETVIYHKTDDSRLGEVIFWPVASEAAINEQLADKQANKSRRFNLNGQPVNTLQPHHGIIIENGRKLLR